MEKWKSTGLFILIILGVLFVFSGLRAVGICNETENYQWNSFWGYCQRQEVEMNCFVRMNMEQEFNLKDSNFLVKDITIEIPCNKQGLKNLIEEFSEEDK